MADAGAYGSAAVQGASTGMALGPWGALIGAGAGLALTGIADLFRDDDPVIDPRTAELDAIARQMASFNSTSGVNAANAAARGIGARTQSEYREVANNPALRNNVGARVAAYNTLHTQSEGNISDALVKGAAVDQDAEMQARTQGAKILDANRQAAFGLEQYNRQQAATPSPIQALLMQGASTMLGKFAGGLGTTTTPQTQPTNPTASGGGSGLIDQSTFSLTSGGSPFAATPYAQPTQPPIQMPQQQDNSLLERIWRNGAGVPWDPLSPYVSNQ